VDVERFSADATAVLDSLGDRLPPDDQDSLRAYLGTGEWGLLADELAAALLEDATPIAAAERDLVRDLLFAFTPTPDDAELHPCIHDRERVLAALNVVSDPPAPSPSPPPRFPDR
jgi:hypothetical protein